jgi:hypothetical protein
MRPFEFVSFAIFIFLVSCSPDPRVAQLVDQNEIIRTVNRLFIETDNRNWSAVVSCFADSVIFDMTSLTRGQPVRLSPQQIVDGWEQGLKSLQAIHHQAGNYLVTAKDNQADVFCYGIAIHYLPNPSNQNTRTFVGSYDVHLMKHGLDWKIDRFKFNLKFLEDNKNL